MYYAPTGGVNCTASSTETNAAAGGSGSSTSGRSGDGEKGDHGAYKPMCGVDVVVSPGGDDKYRCEGFRSRVGGGGVP